MKFFFWVFIYKSLQGQKWPHNCKALVHVVIIWNPQMIAYCSFLTMCLFIYLNLVSVTFSCNNVFCSADCKSTLIPPTTCKNQLPLFLSCKTDLSTFVISYTQRNKPTYWIYEKREREKETIVHRVYSKSSIPFSSSWEVFSSRNINVLSFFFLSGGLNKKHPLMALFICRHFLHCFNDWFTKRTKLELNAVF